MKKKKQIKAWAIIKGRSIVWSEDGAMLKCLLIFRAKYQAQGMLWKPGEKIARVTITRD